MRPRMLRVFLSQLGDDSAPFNPEVIFIKHFDIHRDVSEGGFGKVNAVIRKKASPVK